MIEQPGRRKKRQKISPARPRHHYWDARSQRSTPKAYAASQVPPPPLPLRPVLREGLSGDTAATAENNPLYLAHTVGALLPLYVTQKCPPKADSFVCPFQQPRDVGQDHASAAEAHCFRIANTLGDEACVRVGTGVTPFSTASLLSFWFRLWLWFRYGASCTTSFHRYTPTTVASVWWHCIHYSE